MPRAPGEFSPEDIVTVGTVLVSVKVLEIDIAKERVKLLVETGKHGYIMWVRLGDTLEITNPEIVWYKTEDSHKCPCHACTARRESGDEGNESTSMGS